MYVWLPNQILEGLSWAHWFEDMRLKISSSQNYVLYKYLPMYFVVAHFLFATKNWMKLKYPSSDVREAYVFYVLCLIKHTFFNFSI